MTGYTCDYSKCEEATNSDNTEGWMEVKLSQPPGEDFKRGPYHFCSAPHLSRFIRENKF
jgi:hypothetical protein